MKKIVELLPVLTISISATTLNVFLKHTFVMEKKIVRMVQMKATNMHALPHHLSVPQDSGYVLGLLDAVLI
jgi:hypothetical protein